MKTDKLNYFNTMTKQILTLILTATTALSAPKAGQIDEQAVASVAGLKFINLAAITRKVDFFNRNRGKEFVAYIKSDSFPRTSIGYGKGQWRISGKAIVHGLYRFTIAKAGSSVSIGALVTSDKATARAIAEQNK